jgi:hypothetical protein
MVAEANLASPLGASPAQIEKEEKRPANAEAPEQRDLFVRAQRRKLPDERKSITHKFSIGGHEGYITVGMYDEGEPGEVFIKMAKEGSTLSGFMDGLALSISIGLQYGVPLKALVDKLTNTRFEPSGFTEKGLNGVSPSDLKPHRESDLELEVVSCSESGRRRPEKDRSLSVRNDRVTNIEPERGVAVRVELQAAADVQRKLILSAEARCEVSAKVNESRTGFREGAEAVKPLCQFHAKEPQRLPVVPAWVLWEIIRLCLDRHVFRQIDAESPADPGCPLARTIQVQPHKLRSGFKAWRLVLRLRQGRLGCRHHDHAYCNCNQQNFPARRFTPTRTSLTYGSEQRTCRDVPRG